MLSSWEVLNSVALLVLPPGGLMLLAAWGAIRLRRRRRHGGVMLGFALAALYACSTTAASEALLRLLEPAPLAPEHQVRGQAVVVLGGGKYVAAPEYRADTVNPQTLARLRYGAAVHRATGKPLLVAGGSPEGSPTAEATAMKAVLESEFRVAVTWTETLSRNTLENARGSRRLLEPAGIRTIFLVTDAWHMRRARLAFERAGFEVIPAATGYQTRFRLTAMHFLPSGQGLRDSSRYFHEVLSYTWYRIQFALDR